MLLGYKHIFDILMPANNTVLCRITITPDKGHLIGCHGKLIAGQGDVQRTATLQYVTVIKGFYLVGCDRQGPGKRICTAGISGYQANIIVVSDYPV